MLFFFFQRRGKPLTEVKFVYLVIQASLCHHIRWNITTAVHCLESVILAVHVHLFPDRLVVSAQIKQVLIVTCSSLLFARKLLLEPSIFLVGFVVLFTLLFCFPLQFLSPGKMFYQFTIKLNKRVSFFDAVRKD